ncbi:MAG: hypothetical protein R3C97_13395 [Geminicoccaceae bacterium]
MPGKAVSSAASAVTPEHFAGPGCLSFAPSRKRPADGVLRSAFLFHRENRSGEQGEHRPKTYTIEENKTKRFLTSR